MKTRAIAYIASFVGTALVTGNDVTFSAGDMPDCTVDSAGRTVVRYDSQIADHANFKCTHTDAGCECVAHDEANCKMFAHTDGRTLVSADCTPPASPTCTSDFTDGTAHRVIFNDFINNAGDIKPLMIGECQYVDDGTTTKNCCKSLVGESGATHGEENCFGGSLNFWGRVFRAQATPSYETCKFCSSQGDCFYTTAPEGECVEDFSSASETAVQFDVFTNSAGDIKSSMTGACRKDATDGFCCKSTAGPSGFTHGVEHCFTGSLNFWGRTYALETPGTDACQFCTQAGDCFEVIPHPV
jgi:hypothetical protein